MRGRTIEFGEVASISSRLGNLGIDDGAEEELFLVILETVLIHYICQVNY